MSSIDTDGLKGKCVINDELGLIYIGNPKTASSSIHHLMGGFNGNFFDLLDSGRTEGKIVFSVVRNPLQRFVSGYLEILGYLRRDIESYKYYSHFQSILEIKDEVRRMKKFIELCEESLCDQHVKKQSYFLSDRNGEPLPLDDLLLFEDLDHDFKRFCTKHGKNMRLSFLNYKSGIATESCNELLRSNLQLVENINAIYREDWNLYGNILMKKLEGMSTPSFQNASAKLNKSRSSEYLKYILEKTPKLHSRLIKLKKAVLRGSK